MRLKSLLRLETLKRTWFLVILSIGVINLSCVCGQLGSPVYEAIAVGETNDLVVDPAGTVHVLYSFYAMARRADSLYGVYYAHRSGDGDWQTEALETRRGHNQVHALGMGPDGALHAFYGTTKHTEYAWKETGGAWEKETFLTNGFVGSVAFDADGAMHLTHVHWLTDTLLLDNVRPNYAYKPADGGFHSREIEIEGLRDVDYGRVSDVAVDSTGRAHVVFDVNALAWHKIDYVQIAAGDGDITSRETIASFWSTNWQPSLAIDSDDSLHLAFTGYHVVESGEEYKPKLKYTVSYDGGETWAEEMLVDAEDETGQSPELAIDDAGGLHIAYLSPESYEVRYAYKAPGAESWSVETVDSDVPTDVDVSLALDGAGNPYILYSRVSPDTPETPKETDTPWAPDMTDTPWTPDRADFLDLKLAHRTGDGRWITETIPSPLR
jgi:hypothetical protein